MPANQPFHLACKLDCNTGVEFVESTAVEDFSCPNRSWVTPVSPAIPSCARIKKEGQNAPPGRATLPLVISR